MSDWIYMLLHFSYIMQHGKHTSPTLLLLGHILQIHENSNEVCEKRKPNRLMTNFMKLEEQ